MISCISPAFTVSDQSLRFYMPTISACRLSVFSMGFAFQAFVDQDFIYPTNGCGIHHLFFSCL